MIGNTSGVEEVVGVVVLGCEMVISGDCVTGGVVGVSGGVESRRDLGGNFVMFSCNWNVRG
jgi:hypothetical protein